MPDIFHDFPVFRPVDEVWTAVTTPAGLDAWWTDRSRGNAVLGSTYELWFGPDYDWRALVTQCEPKRVFELEFTIASDDWIGTRVGFLLEGRGDQTQVRFHHTDWPELSEHFRISTYCWAMYLRIMKRWLEHGEVVPYRDRLDV